LAKLPAFPPRYFNPGELDRLVWLVASVTPRSMVEIGCNEARAASTILRNVDSIEQYVGIDVLPGYITLKPCQRKEVPTEPGKFAKLDPRFRLIVKPQGSFDLTAADLPQAVCAVFIDGDHGAQAVRHDTALARAVLRPGGILIWHDDNNRDIVDVSATLDEFAAHGAHITHVENTWLAFERID